MIETLITITIITLTSYELMDLLVYQDGPYMVFADIRHYFGTDDEQDDGKYSLVDSILSCPYCCGVWSVIVTSLAVLPFLEIEYKVLIPVAAMGLLTVILDYNNR